MSTQAASPSKKRKHPENSGDTVQSISKKVKKNGKDKSKKRDKKGKGRQEGAEGEFKVVSASIRLSIPPRFAMSPMSGVLEMLDSLIMRYVPALRGVMLSHTNTRFLSQTAMIKNECPFAICDVAFDATVWSPQLGMKLLGKINLCSPDHVSLLVHQTFNVSIPRYHIPSDDWEFEYGPAENDPEFGPHAIHVEEKTDNEINFMEVDGPTSNVVGDPASQATEAGGIWVHRATGDRLGGKDGFLEFTVIGLTVANQMLSLVGSIQPDPFSPEHVPQSAVGPKVKQAEDSRKVEDEEAPAGNIAPENESSDEEDPFATLGRAQEEATEMLQARERQEKAKKEEKKRKKKEKKAKKDENDAAHKVSEEGIPSKKKRKSKAE